VGDGKENEQKNNVKIQVPFSGTHNSHHRRDMEERGKRNVLVKN
jgi:hypothetical protein